MAGLSSLYQTFLVVGEVQTPPTHDRLPSLLLLPAGALDGAILPGVCSEEMPGVREGGGAGLHAGQGELEEEREGEPVMMTVRRQLEGRGLSSSSPS